MLRLLPLFIEVTLIRYTHRQASLQSQHISLLWVAITGDGPRFFLGHSIDKADHIFDASALHITYQRHTKYIKTA